MSLCALGSICHARGNLDDADQFFKKAMDLHTECDTEGSVAAAAVLNDYALLRRDQGFYKCSQ